MGLCEQLYTNGPWEREMSRSQILRELCYKNVGLTPVGLISVVVRYSLITTIRKGVSGSQKGHVFGGLLRAPQQKDVKKPIWLTSKNSL